MDTEKKSESASKKLACCYTASDAEAGIPPLGGADLGPTVAPLGVKTVPMAGPSDGNSGHNEENRVREAVWHVYSLHYTYITGKKEPRDASLKATHVSDEFSGDVLVAVTHPPVVKVLCHAKAASLGEGVDESPGGHNTHWEFSVS